MVLKCHNGHDDHDDQDNHDHQDRRDETTKGPGEHQETSRRPPGGVQDAVLCYALTICCYTVVYYVYLSRIYHVSMLCFITTQ